jgi:prepilin-type processing-associated H-X9-DG protein
METIVSYLNSAGNSFVKFAFPMLVQSSVLIAFVLGLDLVLRRNVRAIVRYCILMLVLVKLVLPPSLSAPTGLFCRLGGMVPDSITQPENTSDSAQPTGFVVTDQEVPVASETVLISGEPAEGRSDLATAASGPLRTQTPAFERPIHRTSPTWQGAAFLLWLAVVATMALALLQRLLLIRGLIARAKEASGTPADLLAECRRHMGIRRKVALRLSPKVTGPAVCGLLRPVILIPEGLPDRLDERQLKSVLLHELAHIKRADTLVNSIQAALQILYFYNPLLWLANAVIRRVREHAVDETVLVVMGNEAEDYPNALLDVSRLLFRRPVFSLRLAGVVESKAALIARIRHMAGRPFPQRANVGTLGVAAVLAVAAALLPMATAGTENAPEEGSMGGSQRKDLDMLVLESRHADEKTAESGRLYMVSPDGAIQGAFTGLHLVGALGGSHMLTIDATRKRLWVAENMGDRLWKFDLSTGKLEGRFWGITAEALAVEPGSGNVWVLTRGDPGRTLVVSPEGKVLARHNVAGSDIVYNPRDKSFWTAGSEINKVDRTGRVVSSMKDLGYRAVSLSVDEGNGDVWVAIVCHPRRPLSRNELWQIDSNANIKRKIDLGELRPMCVEVDSENDSVWVGCLGTTLRYSTDGIKLKSARWASGGSISAGLRADQAYIASREGVRKVKVAESGDVESDELFRSLYDESVTYRWIARVPFSGAKLESSSQLAELASPETTSMHKMKEIGLAILCYANDHEGRLPDSIDQIKPYLSEAKLRWCGQNVEYIGSGSIASGDGNTPIAYDRTLLKQGQWVNIVFLDGHVERVRPDRLAAFGINPGR